jgi:hypothetical protein
MKSRKIKSAKSGNERTFLKTFSITGSSGSVVGL